MRNILLLLLLSLRITEMLGQGRVVSWNVENLFDCRHDTLKDDHEFLPDGSQHWTPYRYRAKLDNVARTIASLTAEDRWPSLVGLCEVENDSVLYDLTRRSPLRAARYAYVMTDSPDRRGIDVALLYEPSDFRLLDYQCIRVPSEEQGLRPTRDILHAWGIFRGCDTLHVLVVHLPSRASRSQESSKNRLLAAQTLSSVVDTLCDKDVLIMGDFNAEQGDPVFKNLTPPFHSLTPRAPSSPSEAEGSYNFRDRWCFLDHILVSPRLLPRCVSQAHVASPPFLLNEDGKPFRTYAGPRYMGGYSDHLPLWVDIKP